MSVSLNIEFNNLLAKTAQSGVSDLHLSVGSKVKARIDGELVDWSKEIVDMSFLEENTLSILNEVQKEELKNQGSVVLSYDFLSNLRFRIQITRQENKISSVLRFIPSQIKSLAELGMPQVIEELCSLRRGLVIVSGVSGSGKTTTIAGILEKINQEQNKSIITLEKPIEFVFVKNKSLIEQREIPTDTPSFGNALVDLKNSDADVIFAGGLYDRNSASQILELAEKCLVILELTSKDIIDGLQDFLSFFEADEKEDKRKILSRNLVAVLNQLLAAKKGGGRVPAVEILFNNTAVASSISENHFARIPEIVVSSGHQGMISKERSLAELVKGEQIALSEALKYAEDKDGLKEMILK